MFSAKTIRSILSSHLSSLDAHTIDDMAMPSYLNRNPLIRWIIKKRLCVIADEMRHLQAKSYLDFGCGLGFLEVLLRDFGRNVYVTDLHLEPARSIHRHFLIPDITYVAPGSLSSIPAGTLDAIVAADVLEHVNDLDSAVSQFNEVLRPGGLCFLSGPTENLFYRLCRKIARYSGEYHARDIYVIEQTFVRFGWEVIKRRMIPLPGPVQMFSITVWRRPACCPGSS